MTLKIDNLTVRYGDVAAVDGVTLTVERGEIRALMGKSGSGKSSLLRAVAGIVPVSSGMVEIRGRDVTELPTHERRIGLMFQSYALFPHLSVAANVAFGISKLPNTAKRVVELLNMVDLAGFQKRPVGDLSGGEQQRVALARTLAPSPDVLLLDEPLGSLDTALRKTLLTDMEAIFGASDIPVLYVTHDPNEAFAIADSITVLSDASTVDAEGTPRSLWTAPPTAMTAQLLGRESVAIAADLPETIAGDFSGTVLVPTEAVRLTGTDVAPTDHFDATVLHVVFAGLTSRATVQCGKATLTLDTTADLARGLRVQIAIDATAVIPLAG